MNRTEYHLQRRKKLAELRKHRVDSAYEFYCALSDEDKQISEFTFARKLAAHLSISLGVARYTTTDLIDEYHIEFVKNKTSNPSCGFSGRSHSAKARAAISEATIERNAARAILCKEKGINYRNYKQEADSQIEVVNFCNNNRITSISDKIII